MICKLPKVYVFVTNYYTMPYTIDCIRLSHKLASSQSRIDCGAKLKELELSQIKKGI